MLAITNSGSIGKWTRLNSGQLPASEAGCIFAHGDYIYYLTGNVSVPSTNNVLWRYTISTATWTTIVCPLPHRQLRTCSKVNNKVYFFGGIPESTQVWQFDLLTETWLQLGNYLYPFYAGVSIAIGTDIYIAGGYSGSGNLPLNRFVRYNTLTDETTTLATLPRITYGPAVYSFNENSLIITGGTDNLANTSDQNRLVYVIDTNRWTSNVMTGLLHPGGFTAFTQSKNLGYAFGGVFNRGLPSDQFDTFNALSYAPVPRTGSHPGARTRSNMVYHDEALYLFGGGNDGSKLSDFWVWEE